MNPPNKNSCDNNQAPIKRPTTNPATNDTSTGSRRRLDASFVEGPFKFPISPPKLLPAVAVAATADVASGILIDVCTDAALVLRVVIGCVEDEEELVLLKDTDADEDKSDENDDVGGESDEESDNDDESDMDEGADEIEDVEDVVGIGGSTEENNEEDDAAAAEDGVVVSICEDEAAAGMLVLL
ncbi:MAG: hypothetical protein GOMPHAMPRED_005802 [Gomphillus americanus]|uniref:Uncharacterized protein n=1 Tax=Gomphillus americanus TaxID=1940652 RepID=A0A8H3FTY9_9LECA|nr:MAG: hypothetical protein GOMPHAMPRED_005802 [Gomphillus americanus]